jgi:addiction module RelE/StbE family toxin
MKTVVDLSLVVKDLDRIPLNLAKKLDRWIAEVEKFGLERVRMRPGWNDHPLHGNRTGQRVIRLNRKWRAVYIVFESEIRIVRIIEVHAHDY